MKKLPETFTPINGVLNRSERNGYNLQEFVIETTQEDTDRAAEIMTHVWSTNDIKSPQKLAEAVGLYVVESVFHFRPFYCLDAAWMHLIKERLKNCVYYIKRIDKAEWEIRLELAKIIAWYNSLEE